MIMNKVLSLVSVVLLSIVFSSCSDSGDEKKTPTDGVEITPTGGALESEDKNISVVIPAGALDENVSISVTEVPNDLTNGVGKIYSFTDSEFLKPVTLTLKYSTTEVSEKGSYPALLKLLTRKSTEDEWTVVQDVVIDQVAHTLSADVTHFSEWTIVTFDGTLNYSMDGDIQEDLALTVVKDNKTGARFRATSTDRIFTLVADSTIMGTAYPTLSAHLDRIVSVGETPGDTVALFVEPRLKSCYNRGDGKTTFKFTQYSTKAGDLVTGDFSVVGTTPTDNSECQARKTITGTFAYKVK